MGDLASLFDDAASQARRCNFIYVPRIGLAWERRRNWNNPELLLEEIGVPNFRYRDLVQAESERALNAANKTDRRGSPMPKAIGPEKREGTDRLKQRSQSNPSLPHAHTISVPAFLEERELEAVIMPLSMECARICRRLKGQHRPMQQDSVATLKCCNTC